MQKKVFEMSSEKEQDKILFAIVMMGLAITAGAIMARILKETINTGQL
jgi:hypothetical protein